MSMTEIALVIVVALILFGPEDLPVVARAIGKVVGEVRKYTDEIGREFKNAMNAPDEMINQAFKPSSKVNQTNETPADRENSKKFIEDDEEELLTYDDPVIQNDTRAGE
ncbi:twin-arginine translocase TatA/TatE family subunit [Dehalobacter sp. DCM]|uniref:twin-arginine translocase TatA/TatE family subunit n=1 Tax=Dehalobacter sp. DCM TaxID=2907827 RepID=UPI003081DC6A|nr:twin-arginine translocase TatA/TatE family subunit [Dehalobacter sp. DCM]